MRRCNRVILVGAMGAGKTSVGKVLSNALNYAFFDTDAFIESNYNRSIPEIFAQQGEKYFRAIEANIFTNLQFADHLVCATGGGSILNPQSRVILANLGLVIYLKVSILEQYSRLSRQPVRPPLPVQRSLWPEYLYHTMLLRSKLYEQIADITISTDGLSIAEIVDELAAKLAAKLGVSN